MSTGRTASPSTPARPSSPRPSCSRSSGRSAAASWPTTSTCARSTPFYRIRFDDGETFDYSGDRAAMRREVARFSPADVAGYERFMRESEAIFRVGFEKLGHVPFRLADGHARGSCPTCSGCTGYRSVYGLVSSYIRDEQAADGPQLPSAAGRRQSRSAPPRSIVSSRFSSALGRAFRDGRHRQRWSTDWSI